jgi:hypothetical protein
MSIDYELLERQRVHLLSVVNERRQGMTTRHALLGLLQLVDYLIAEGEPNLNASFSVWHPVYQDQCHKIQEDRVNIDGADIVNSVPRMPPPSGVVSPDYPYETNVSKQDT